MHKGLSQVHASVVTPELAANRFPGVIQNDGFNLKSLYDLAPEPQVNFINPLFIFQQKFCFLLFHFIAQCFSIGATLRCVNGLPISKYQMVGFMDSFCFMGGNPH